MTSSFAPKNTLLGATNYDPRLKSHLKPQRFKLVESHLRIDSTLSQLNQLTTRSDLPDARDFDTTARDIGGKLGTPLQESKFAPQNVNKVLCVYECRSLTLCLVKMATCAIRANN